MFSVLSLVRISLLTTLFPLIEQAVNYSCFSDTGERDIEPANVPWNVILFTTYRLWLQQSTTTIPMTFYNTTTFLRIDEYY